MGVQALERAARQGRCLSRRDEMALQADLRLGGRSEGQRLSGRADLQLRRSAGELSRAQKDGPLQV